MFRFEGMAAPSGEITLDTLARLASVLQELVTRVGRFVVGQHGPGRTLSSPAKVVSLRLTGLRRGSTVLDVAFGESDVLDLDVGVELEIADRFWEIVQAVSAGESPSWITPPLAESALRAIDAFGSAAEQTVIQRADGRVTTWKRGALPREPWLFSDETPGTDLVIVTGRLEKVDLTSRSFRIRDDVGNTIALQDVADVDAAGPLVGQRTTASGSAVRRATGQLRAVRDAVIAPASVPKEWKAGWQADAEAVLRAAPGPDPDGIDGVTEVEVDAFLALINE